MYSLRDCVTLRGVTHTSDRRDVPYVPGPASPAPVHPAQAPAPQQNHVVVGATVDLAHELAQLRKLGYTSVALLAGTLLFSIVAAVSSGFVAWVVYRFLDALNKAFG
jgi:hypothetical protein